MREYIKEAGFLFGQNFNFCSRIKEIREKNNLKTFATCCKKEMLHTFGGKSEWKKNGLKGNERKNYISNM